MATGADTAFIKLRVYLEAEELADRIWTVVVKWDSFAKYSVGKQLVRAADSVGANIAEGAGRGSYQDNRRFVKIARGSLNETRHWLRRANQRGFLPSEEVSKISNLINDLAPRLNAYLKSIGTSSGTKVSPPSKGPMTNDK